MLLRCRRQGAEERPLFARPRLSADPREFSGALGDLGTLLPYLLAAIVTVGLPAAGVLLGFGLFLVATGLVFALPLAVQPMKVIGAAMIALPMTPGAVAASGLLVGAFFLVAAATGLLTRLTRLIGSAVAAGLQLGLALLLGGVALEMMASAPLAGGLTAALLAGLAWSLPRFPAALVVLPLATLAIWWLQGFPALPAPTLGLYLPLPRLPSGEELVTGLLYGALPQIPLTLANAVVVTAALARHYFPNELHGVDERRLGLSTGLSNLLLAPFGALPMCHGAGGLAAQYRFGGRSGTPPLALGLVLLAAGLLLGEQAAMLLQAVPEALLGALLLIAAVELGRSARPQALRGRMLAVVGATAATTLLLNPAAALLGGLLLERLLRERNRR